MWQYNINNLAAKCTKGMRLVVAICIIASILMMVVPLSATPQQDKDEKELQKKLEEKRRNFLYKTHPEYKIKSLFLGVIPQHVEWPDSPEWNDKTKPFRISVFGENPFGDFLDEDFARRRIYKKEVEIRYIDEISQIGHPNILFIADVNRKTLDAIIQYTQNKPILTMGDTPGYVERGVHINVTVEKKEVKQTIDGEVIRKEAPSLTVIINETATRKSGFVLKESFLKNARIVNPFHAVDFEAAGLEKLTRFIEWPNETGVDDPSTPFIVAVIGDKAFGRAVESIYKDSRIKKKRVQVHYVTSIDQIGTPHILYISQSEINRITEILSYTRKKPILTLGSSAGFARWGVHINFYFERDVLSFEINNLAAREARLIFNDLLLSGARLVNPYK